VARCGLRPGRGIAWIGNGIYLPVAVSTHARQDVFDASSASFVQELHGKMAMGEVRVVIRFVPAPS